MPNTNSLLKVYTKILRKNLISKFLRRIFVHFLMGISIIPKSAKLKIKNRQGNGFIIKKNDKKYCKFFFTHLVKKKTSVKKVNFRITKPFSHLKSI